MADLTFNTQDLILVEYTPEDATYFNPKTNEFVYIVEGDNEGEMVISTIVSEDKETYKKFFHTLCHNNPDLAKTLPEYYGAVDTYVSKETGNIYTIYNVVDDRYVIFKEGNIKDEGEINIEVIDYWYLSYEENIHNELENFINKHYEKVLPKEYEVEIKETLSKTIKVSACTKEEAKVLAEDIYAQEQVVLTSDNYVDTEFIVKEGN